MNHDSRQGNAVVSIFTLTYNQEAYISQCIDSVLAQKFTDWEMIILDDGSTDATWTLIQRYMARDERIKGHRRTNKGIFGLAEAYNWMLEQSSGTFIAILDGDDFWSSNKLSSQVVYHLRHGFNFTFGRCITVSADTNEPLGAIPNKADGARITIIENKGDLSSEYLHGSFPISAVTCMIDRSYLVKIKGFTQPHYLPTTDYPTWVNILKTDCKTHFIDAELGFWRIQAGQTTWKRAREMAIGMLQYAKETANGLNDEAVMSAGRRNFISDSLYRHAIYNLNQKNIAEVKVALNDLIKFKGYRHIFKFIATVSVRTTRTSWLKIIKRKNHTK